MKQLTETSFAIPVPKEAKNFEAIRQLLRYTVDGKNGWCLIPIGFKFTPVGTVIQDSIDFDPSGVVEGWRRENGAIVDGEKNQWLNYSNTFSSNPNEAFYSTPEQSLRSAITEAGYYWENPIPEPMWDDSYETEDGTERFGAEVDEWKAAQTNVVEKLLIIQKI